MKAAHVGIVVQCRCKELVSTHRIFPPKDRDLPPDELAAFGNKDGPLTIELAVDTYCELTELEERLAAMSIDQVAEMLR